MKHLQPAPCCALQVASQKLRRKKGRTSHFTLEEVGWFSDMAASRLPEYCSLVVSRVNGKVTGDVTGIFCHSVTCLRTNQCCWDGNHLPGGFMNVSQYLLGKVCRKIWFPASLSLCTCNLHVDVPCRLHPRNSLTKERKGFSLHT